MTLRPMARRSCCNASDMAHLIEYVIGDPFATEWGQQWWIANFSPVAEGDTVKFYTVIGCH